MGAAAGVALDGIDEQIQPARGAIDSDVQVATCRFVGHLFQFDLNEAGRIVLECFAHTTCTRPHAAQILAIALDVTCQMV